MSDFSRSDSGRPSNTSLFAIEFLSSSSKVKGAEGVDELRVDKPTLLGAALGAALGGGGEESPSLPTTPSMALWATPLTGPVHLRANEGGGEDDGAAVCVLFLSKRGFYDRSASLLATKSVRRQALALLTLGDGLLGNGAESGVRAVSIIALLVAAEFGSRRSARERDEGSHGAAAREHSRDLQRVRRGSESEDEHQACHFLYRDWVGCARRAISAFEFVKKRDTHTATHG